MKGMEKQSEQNSAFERLKKILLNDLLWGAILVVLLSAILSEQFKFGFPEYVEGDIPNADIKAPIDIALPDMEATAKRIEEAKRLVLPVYDFESISSRLRKEEIEHVFSQAREALSSYIREEYGFNPETPEAFSDFLEKDADRENKILDFLRNIEADISSMDRQVNAQFLRQGFSTEIENAVSSVVVNLQKNKIVLNKEQLLKSPVIKLKDTNPNKEEEEIRDFKNIIDITDAKEKISEGFEDIKKRELRQACIEYSSHLISPNLTYNKAETDKRKADAESLVEEVVLIIKKGTVIAREGDPVDSSTLLKLEAVRKATSTEFNLYKLVGLASILTLLMISVWRYSSPYKTYIKSVKHLFILIVTVIVSSSLIMYILMFIADSLADKLSIPPFHITEAYYYGIPIAAGAILLTLLVDANIAIIFSIPFSVIMGIMTGNSILFMLYSLLSCLSSIYAVRHYKQRTALIKTGFVISLFNIAAVVSLSLFFDKLHPLKGLDETLFAAFCGFAGGIFSTALVSFALPMFENLFDILTDIKLLELSNMNNPLLKELSAKAPGTYTHSVIVGNLAEAAAESIGANALFCRVSAYYHDIGKVRMPEYFVENQGAGENKHDALSPSMSSLIIMNHVKEGMELAREHKLSKAIRDIIPQHHGTRLVTYFYSKAKEKALNGDAKQIREEDFRYPGPKPQTKEAAIFMLADAVEAASRTIEEPTSGRIKGMIKDVVNKIVIDGQLDECNLTFKDLDKISDSFHFVLLGMMHQRVKYPGFNFDKNTSKKKNGKGRK